LFPSILLKQPKCQRDLVRTSIEIHPFPGVINPCKFQLQSKTDGDPFKGSDRGYSQLFIAPVIVRKSKPHFSGITKLELTADHQVRQDLLSKISKPGMFFWSGIEILVASLERVGIFHPVP